MPARSLTNFLIAPLALLALSCIALIRERKNQKAELNEIKAQAEIEARNKGLVRREYEQVWNQEKLDAIEDIYTADFVVRTPGSPDIHGLEGVKTLANMFYTAFPDMQYTIEDMIAEGDRAAVGWRLTGTRKGEPMGVPMRTCRCRSRGSQSSVLPAVSMWKSGAAGKLGACATSSALIPPIGQGGSNTCILPFY